MEQIKQIVIVDDRPWKMQDCIREFQNQGIRFCKTLYYPDFVMPVEIPDDQWICKYEKATGLNVYKINDMIDFIDQMDKSYNTPNTIFFMDYDLKGDMSYSFWQRINVKYATARDKEQQRIWFYTAGPKDIKKALLDAFPGHLLDVHATSAGRLYWELEQVFKAVGIDQ